MRVTIATAAASVSSAATSLVSHGPALPSPLLTRPTATQPRPGQVAVSTAGARSGLLLTTEARQRQQCSVSAAASLVRMSRGQEATTSPGTLANTLARYTLTSWLVPSMSGGQEATVRLLARLLSRVTMGSWCDGGQPGHTRVRRVVTAAGAAASSVAVSSAVMRCAASLATTRTLASVSSLVTRTSTRLGSVRL